LVLRNLENGVIIEVFYSLSFQKDKNFQSDIAFNLKNYFDLKFLKLIIKKITKLFFCDSVQNYFNLELKGIISDKEKPLETEIQ